MTDMKECLHWNVKVTPLGPSHKSTCPINCTNPKCFPEIRICEDCGKRIS